MQRAQVPSRALRIQALGQQDLLTTRQASAAGLGKDALDRMIRDGHWERQANGLFDTAPGHDSFMKLVWAAALRADEPFAIGGAAALRLHGIERPVERVTVWVPPDRRPRSGDGFQIRRDKVGRVARGIGAPCRIRAEDALVDVGQGLAVDDLVALLTDATRLRITTTDRLRHTLNARRRVRDRAVFTEILGDLDGIESTLEYVYRRDVERAHGLPAAKRQESASAGTRSDAWYEDYEVLVELDGRFGHEDARSTFRDLSRDNAHTVRRLATLRYGSADVRGRPCDVARQVGLVLRGRGWAGALAKCPRCGSASGH